MRITLGNIDGKALGLNASEACVYAAIEKCSRGDNAKGWYGTMEALAGVLPCRIYRTTVSRAIAKLLTLGLIKEEGERLYVNVQIAQNDVQNAHENVQNAPPPNNPPINKENKMERENSCTHTPTRDAATPASSFDVFMAWYEHRYGSVIYEMHRYAKIKWQECTKAKQSALIAAARDCTFDKPRPDWFITDFPEPEPKDYNGARLLPDEPLVIAKYNDRAGLYTRRDAEIFGMNILKPFVP